MKYFHQPVLVNEVLDWLKLKANDNVIDGTVGGGGHASAILEKTSPSGKLLGLDRDPQAIAAAGENLQKYRRRISLICESYKNINKIIYEQRPFTKYHHLLLDLGVSSAQFETDEKRGFSFHSQGLLDMRFGPQGSLTAQEIINHWPEQRLTEIYKNYGEERHAKLIAKNIVLYRKVKSIETAEELSNIVCDTVGKKRGKIHPATKVFQALRITVNDELNVLKESLENFLEVLPVQGRLAIISYHSLEDRIVKQFFKSQSLACICPKDFPVCRCDHQPKIKILTKKPITPGPLEIENNPRSRSAKLRVVEKL